MNEIVSLHNLEKSYIKDGHQTQALRSIDLSVEKGDFVLVKGASGSGKTTMLLVLGGMLQPTSGKVQISGKNLYELPEKQKIRFRANNIGFIFQMFHLIPYLNVRENILLNNEIGIDKISEQELIDLTDELGINHRLRHYPSELSAGEKQRVALARALIKKPELILADEPTGNLDAENSQIVLEKLKEYCSKGGTVIMVTHDDYPEVYANKKIIIDQKTENINTI
ncbi:ABC transporter ATP-binding protein [Reichenbachiella sp. MALMAid0571]|uniref:ABC transporter ATP-binding protein n=1 Tax=Reichenbachiella sp. MALMAid0571 TaxID=3143939 RepID=UPI0032DFC3A5